jgi:DNA-directed RNA polymerase subunit RPC12/RpoP
MKCPWCSREVGIVNPRGVTTCPYCSGRMTVAFRAKSALLYFCIAGAIAVLLFPYLGRVGLIVAAVASLAGSAYLERWY